MLLYPKVPGVLLWSGFVGEGGAIFYDRIKIKDKSISPMGIPKALGKSTQLL